MPRKFVVGDDTIEFARGAFADLKKKLGEDIETYFADTPEGLLKLAEEHPDADVVTDLNYTFDGFEGYDVLKALAGERDVYLWTGIADVREVQKKAAELGARGVIPKNRLGTFFGCTEGPEAVPEAEPYTDKVLVVYTEGPKTEVIKKIVSAILGYDADRLRFIPREELRRVEGRYRQVVYIMDPEDTGTGKGYVDHEDKYRDIPLGHDTVRDVSSMHLTDVTKEISEALHSSGN